MKAKEIINEIASSKEYKALCKNITKGNELHEDLFQELILILCEKSPEVIEGMHERKELKWFIVKILQNQFNSNRSKFYKDNVSFSQKSSDLHDNFKQDENEKVTEYYFDVLEHEKRREVFTSSSEWYENNIFKSYLLHGSLRKLSAATGISRNAISNTVSNYVDKIKAHSEVKKRLMDSPFIQVQLPEDLKEAIFVKYLNTGISPGELIVQHLKIVNKRLKRNNAKQAPNSQLMIQLTFSDQNIKIAI